MPSKVAISRTSIKRLIRDVRNLLSTPLTEHGIHYQHSDEDVLKGQALIIGPSGTPYAGGFYLFDIAYPPDYPHKPPVVMFRTNDGRTRMNPNLYKCGKVCVSILNTWKGDAWTGCQTISTMLLALVSLLNSNPRLNEPGVAPTNPDCPTYNRIMAYKNVEVAMCMVLASESLRKHFAPFVKTMESSFLASFDDTIAALEAAQGERDRNGVLTTAVYRLRLEPDYEALAVALRELRDNILTASPDDVRVRTEAGAGLRENGSGN